MGDRMKYGKKTSIAKCHKEQAVVERHDRLRSEVNQHITYDERKTKVNK